MHRADKKLYQKENPLETVNIFSRLTFWWMKDVFKLGIGGPIASEEIYKPKSNLESQRITDNFVELWEEELTKKNPNVLRMIIKIYGFPLLLWGIPFSVVETGIRIIQPLCLGGLVSYFAPGQTHISKCDAYLYAGCITFSTVVTILTFHPYFLFIFETATKIRLGCSGLVYRKTLNFCKSAVYDGLNGKVINLIANDLQKFELALAFMHDIWKGPLEAILFGYFIYQQIGVAGIWGMAFLLSFIPIQAYVGRKSAQLRWKTAERTDVRIKIMNEIILGIQVIKMYAWEKSFASMVDAIRKKEVNAIRGTAYLRATLFSFGMISRLAIFISLVTYIYFGNVITAQKVFIVFSFFNILNFSMVFSWPTSLANTAEALISVKRIQEFLLASEKKPEEKEDCRTNDQEVYKNGCVSSGKISPKDHHPSNGIVLLKLKVLDTEHTTSRLIVNLDAKVKQIVMKNVTATWEKGDKADAGIYGLNLMVRKRELCSIVGPVGAGKSTLLNVIIGELDLDVGDCLVNGSVSYASQESWLFDGTVQTNIIFIEKFDQQRYKEVVRVCGLERDFQLMPNGDMTVVGERGISLSGGQKARINLARAVYKEADFYLLDDPLSAVDVHVGRHIFQECVQTFLKNKGCILVTHQLQYLKDVDHLVLMSHGRVESQGTYTEVCKTSMDSFLMSLDEKESEDAELKQHQRLPTSSIGDEDIVEESGDGEETQAVGAVEMSVYKSYFTAVNSFTYISFVVTMFIFAQGLVTGVDLYISQWSNWEEQVATDKINLTANFQSSLRSDAPNGLLLDLNDSITMTSVFLEHEDNERTNYIITYSILMAVATYVYVHRTFAFFSMCLEASIKLHDRLFRGVTRATMYFYRNNPSGRILNRFSRDINNIDTLLPQSINVCASFFLELFAIMIIVVITNFWLLIPTFVMMALFYILRCFYINTARSLKRTDSLTQSPIYSHINTTLQGLSTVRAFNAQQILESEFYSREDYNTGALHLRIATNRAFAFWLDVVCLLFIMFVTFSFIMFDKGNAKSGNIGLSILYCLNLIEKCQYGMRQTAEMEAQMTSVERVVEYAEITSESPLESEPKYRPPNDWPCGGEIILKELNFRYSENGNYVLKNLNLKIEAKEKIGIVGRTGSGKSTMMQAIFRLAELNGEIIIDGVVTNTLGLHDLRKKIMIIPQDSVLFSGTLRFNLDPFNEHTDADMWDALEQVELKRFVSALVDGLDCKMLDGGSNFSMGHRQLVCLARAILRNNKILICDEATANVDPETDKLIQTTIRKKFSDCTVLTIAHRLHTVMDNDRILVIDAGIVVEFGHPYELLQHSDGYLRQLVDQTGASTAKALMQMAAESFAKK